MRISASIGSAALCVVLAGCHTASPSLDLAVVDVIFVGGQVFDGTDKPGVMADVVIKSDEIVFVGPSSTDHYVAKSVIDVRGMVVAPGFIDPHTHASGDLASGDAKRRANLPFALQGVTTVVVGNDGRGRPEIATQANLARKNGIGTNVAYLVGLGPVREAEVGLENRAPRPAELETMKQSVRTAMCEGAWGLSTGLYYVPQSFAQTDEVIALARVAAGLGGYYDTHMRDESTYNITVTGAVAEALKIGREAGLPVHIAHIKALGPAVWGHSTKMIALIEEARAAGQRVTADQYPWSASGTRISSALVSRWALEGGLDALRKRLANDPQRARIRAEMVEAIERRGGADKLLVTGRLSGAQVEVGKTLLEVAQAQAIEPADAAIAILGKGDARLASFNMSQADIAAFAKQDWIVTGSDGSNGHPRKYGSFPKAYRDFVIGDGGMSLARFIHRSTGQTADIIGLNKRGYLKPGNFADVLVFDPASFAPRADYKSPREFSQGVIHLLVNGQPVVADGQYTNALPGRPLLKATQCN